MKLLVSISCCCKWRIIAVNCNWAVPFVWTSELVKHHMSLTQYVRFSARHKYDKWANVFHDDACPYSVGIRIMFRGGTSQHGTNTYKDIATYRHDIDIHKNAVQTRLTRSVTSWHEQSYKSGPRSAESLTDNFCFDLHRPIRIQRGHVNCI